jgi:DNA-binding NarL/FixJ family response regulator
MTAPEPIRIVLVDDQELVRTGLRMILESEPGLRVLGEAADGSDAVALVARTRPDVVLMDVRMPVMDGVEATGRVLAEVRTRVIILTTFDLDEYVFAALRNGASGFLLKDAPAGDLIEAIRVVAGGEALLAPTVTRRLIEHYRNGSGTVPEPPRLGDLTEREREVLVEMARGRSNAEIAIALHVSETTVKTHVSRVLAKLELRDRVQAVVLAYECGVVRPGASG